MKMKISEDTEYDFVAAWLKKETKDLKKEIKGYKKKGSIEDIYDELHLQYCKDRQRAFKTLEEWYTW